MKTLALILTALFAVSCATPAEARRSRRHGKKSSYERYERHDAMGTITLNGHPTDVRWSDGDSFNIKSGPYSGLSSRLVGYNTLEAYGPVHRWGDWTAKELYDIAKKSSAVAAMEEWECTTDGKKEGYGRLLVTCPKLNEHMVREGVATAYAVENTKPQEGLLEIQAQAMKAGAGMWAKGTVNGIITSLHSIDEERGSSGKAYNRIVDTRTGSADKRGHERRYNTCEEVCEDIDGTKSCMVYVPFENRYKNKPDCLK